MLFVVHIGLLYTGLRSDVGRTGPCTQQPGTLLWECHALRLGHVHVGLLSVVSSAVGIVIVLLHGHATVWRRCRSDRSARHEPVLDGLPLTKSLYIKQQTQLVCLKKPYYSDKRWTSFWVGHAIFYKQTSGGGGANEYIINIIIEHGKI